MLLIKNKITRLERSFGETPDEIGVTAEMIEIGCNEVAFTILHIQIKEILAKAVGVL